AWPRHIAPAHKPNNPAPSPQKSCSPNAAWSPSPSARPPAPANPAPTDIPALRKSQRSSTPPSPPPIASPWLLLLKLIPSFIVKHMSHVATSFLVLVSFTSVTQADAIGLFTEQKDIGVVLH